MARHATLGPSGWTAETLVTDPLVTTCAAVVDGSVREVLTFAAFDGTHWKDSGSGWNAFFTLDGNAAAGNAWHGAPISVEPDPFGTLHVITLDGMEGPPRYWNSSDQDSSPYLPYVPNSACGVPDVAVDGGGSVHVAAAGWQMPIGTDPAGFKEHGAVMYSKLTAGVWTQETILHLYPDLGFTGRAGIAVGAAQEVHIGVGTNADQLSGLVHLSKSSGSWTTEIVDGAGLGEIGPAKGIAEVAVTGPELHIVYTRQNGSSYEIARARRCTP